MGFPGGLAGKNLPATQEPQETQIRCVGQEDPLEKVMANLSSILAWRTPWTEEPGGLQSMVLQRVRHDWATDTFTFTSLVSYPKRENVFHKERADPRLTFSDSYASLFHLGNLLLVIITHLLMFDN